MKKKTIKPKLSDKQLINLMQKVRTELHAHMGTLMCKELHADCIDCKTRYLIGLLNSWIDILTPFTPKKPKKKV